MAGRREASAAQNQGTGPAMAFMSMGMAGTAGGAGAQNLYQMGQQAQSQQTQPSQQSQQSAPGAGSWTCPGCGTEVIGKFRPECGSRKPEPKQVVTCPWCGVTTTPDASGCCEYCGGSVNG